MTAIRSVQVDKIASLAGAQNLGSELRLSDDIVCEEGVLVAVEVLNNKSRYNTLELTSGRMAVVKRGDIVVGALGHRKALFGYSGVMPEALVPEFLAAVPSTGLTVAPDFEYTTGGESGWELTIEWVEPFFSIARFYYRADGEYPRRAGNARVQRIGGWGYYVYD